MKSRLPKSFVSKYGVNELKEKGLSIVIIIEDETTYSCAVDKMIYVRDSYQKGKKGKPIGVVVIDKGYCGWSLCHKNDKWDKLLGIYKAVCKLQSKKTVEDLREKLTDNMNVERSKNNYTIKMLNLITVLNWVINKKDKK